MLSPVLLIFHIIEAGILGILNVLYKVGVLFPALLLQLILFVGSLVLRLLSEPIAIQLAFDLLQQLLLLAELRELLLQFEALKQLLLLAKLIELLLR